MIICNKDLRSEQLKFQVFLGDVKLKLFNVGSPITYVIYYIYWIGSLADLKAFSSWLPGVVNN